MKKNLIIFLLVVIAVCISFADVIPEGHHVVSHSVIIENCDEYPEYTLVGYITGPMIEGYELLIVEQDVPLTKGYKFNTLKLYAIRQEVIDAAGGIENIDYDSLIQVVSPVEIIDPAGFTIEDANPLVSEKITYTVWGVENGTLVLYISERRLEYNDGSPDTVEYFTYTP